MANNTNRVIDETIGAFKKLKEEVKQYKDELATLTAGTDKWRETAEKLRNTQKQVDAINKAAKGTLTAYNKEQVNSINNLKERIKLLNQERNAMDMNSKEYKEATAELKELNDKLREAGTSAGDWRANVGNYANSIKDALGDLGGTVNGLTGSFGGLNAGMLKLASNPVGATVLAVASGIKFLAEGIKSSEENTNKWNEAMIPLKTVLVMIQKAAQDAASKFADWVISLRQNETAIKAVNTVLKVFFTIVEDTKVRIQNLKEALSTVGNAFKNAFNKAGSWVDGVAKKFPNLTKKVEELGEMMKEKIHNGIMKIIGLNDKVASSWFGKLLGLKTSQQIKEIGEAAEQATEEVVEDFKEVEEQVTKTTLAANKLAETLRGLGHQAASLTVEIKQLAAEYAEALEEKDYDKAQELLKKKTEKEIELAKTQVAIASAQLNVIRQQNALSKSGTADLNAEAQAMDAVTIAAGGVADAQREAAQQQKALNKLIEAAAKEKQTEAFKNAIAELTRQLNDFAATYNNVVNATKEPIKPDVFTPDNIDTYYDQMIANAQMEYDAYVELVNKKIEALEAFVEREKALGNDVAQYETQLIALRREAEDGFIKEQSKLDKVVEKSNKDRLKATKAFNKSQLSSYADLFDGISGMFEQESIAYKATATAKAIIATYLAATESFANAGGAPWGFIPMAASIAAGLANVKQIWSTNAKGENSVPSANSYSPSIAEPAINEGNPYTYTRTVQTFEEEDNLNRPMYVSVVDINNVQNRVKVTEEESSW